VSLTTLSVQLRIYATNSMAKCVHPDAVIKIEKQKLFCTCVAWHGFY